MLVAIAGHWIGNMPVEVLNLGEKRCVELLFTNGKSHLLRNVIGKIIHHQSSSNDLEMLQSLLREWQNREGHALAVTSKWHELYVVNVIFWGYSVLIGHLNMKEGGILYEARWWWFNYISNMVISQLFYLVARRPKNLINIKHLISSVQNHTLKLWWN